MISTRLRNLLEQNGIAFQVLPHDPAFSAQQLAARIHVPGREFVKAVVVRLDDRYAIAAVPAHRLVDEKALARVAGAKQCRLATEAEFRDLFPECELGAMPPVGRLYNLPTYVDDEVTRDESIVANAGTHAEAIRLRYLDLARIVEPIVGRFGVPSPTELPRQRTVRKARPKTASAGRKPAATRKRAPRKGRPKARPKKAAGPKKAVGRKKTAGRKKIARRKTSARRSAGARRAVRKTRTKAARGRNKAPAKKAARRKTAAKKRRR